MTAAFTSNCVDPIRCAHAQRNLWRTTPDIQPNYGSMLSNFHKNVTLAQYAAPGHWNDPDMLEIGNGMSATEDRIEFSLWAEMAAPLPAGDNLVNASSTTPSILGDKAVIAVDQDKLGRHGRMIHPAGGNPSEVTFKTGYARRLDIIRRPFDGNPGLSGMFCSLY